ncbi:MAG TPA: Ig-like domain-containing protein [Thermoplasmata archaeon]|nr:Ig-like domain-containing protein [Thermoplasmata archaeon]
MSQVASVGLALVFVALSLGVAVAAASPGDTDLGQGAPASTGAGPPEVKFVSPTNGSIVNGSVQVRVSANDTDGMSRMEISLDGYVEYTNTSNLSLYTWSWVTTTTFNGAHELAASGLDKTGARNTTRITVTVNNTMNDTILPSVLITSPANNSKVSGRVPVMANASDDTKLIQVTFAVDGVPQQRNVSSGGSLLFVWDTSDPQNGTHNLTAEAIDQAGNRNVAKITVFLDNDRIRPVVSVIEPVANASVKGSVVVEALASDDRSLAKVDLYVDGNFSLSNSSGSGGTYGFLWDSTSVAAGAHVLMLVAVDATGNSASASVSVTVEPQDKQGPAVAIIEPVIGQNLRREAQVLVNASDPSGVAKVEFLVDKVIMANATGAPYAWTWDTRSAPNGARELRARATDTLGNVAEAAITVLVQNAKPPVIVSPRLAEKVFGWWTINGTAPPGTAGVNVSVDQNPWQPTKLDASMTWEVAWNTSNITAGAHTLFARTFDGIDFSAEIQVNVTVVRPLVLITNLTEDQVLQGKIEIRGTAQFAERVELSINKGANWSAAKGVDNWNISWDTQTAPNGAYEVWARAWDGASYSPLHSVNITVSNPVVPPPGLPPEAGGIAALGLLLVVIAVLVMISRRKPASEEAVGAEEMGEETAAKGGASSEEIGPEESAEKSKADGKSER